MSGEMMTFPESPEEFIEQYSFTDKERVYTNGSELIPVFRVRQMLEHYTRNPMERILTRLEEMTTSYNPYDSYYEENQYRATKFENAIRNKAIEEIKKVIKEEGGIE